MSNRKCFISGCDSTDFIEKLMLDVPRNPLLREKWFAAARQNVTQNQAWCCEDHFDLEHDVENWVWSEHEGNGVILKPNVVPHLNLWTEELKLDVKLDERIPESTRKRKYENKDLQSPPSCADQNLFEIDQNITERTFKRLNVVSDDCRKCTTIKKTSLDHLENENSQLSDQLAVDSNRTTKELAQDKYGEEPWRHDTLSNLVPLELDSSGNGSVDPLMMMAQHAGGSVVLLKKWSQMEHLSIEELAEIDYFHAYPSKIKEDLHLSALYITKDGKVFGTGCNTLIMRNQKYGDIIQMKKCQYQFVKDSVEVTKLSELGLQKIVIGGMFGAGLTTKNDVWIWGIRLDGIFEKSHHLVANVNYQRDSKCHACFSKEAITNHKTSSASSCTTCTTEAGKSFQLHRKPFKWLVKFNKKAALNCLNCGRRCTEDLGMSYCSDCLLVRYAWDDGSPSFRKFELGEGAVVKDIACGGNFLVMLLKSNGLGLSGWINYKCFDRYIENPDDIEITYLTCGYAHIAVLNGEGELYTCGLGSDGQLGYLWDSSMGYTKLRRVQVVSNVMKVCCGKTNTVCLTENGDIWCCGRRMKHSGELYLNQPDQSVVFQLTKITTNFKFVDIASSHFTTDVFSAKEEGSTILLWGCKQTNKSHDPELVPDASECFEAFVDRPVTYIDPVNPFDQHGDLLFVYPTLIYSEQVPEIQPGSDPSTQSSGIPVIQQVTPIVQQEIPTTEQETPIMELQALDWFGTYERRSDNTYGEDTIGLTPTVEKEKDETPIVQNLSPELPELLKNLYGKELLSDLKLKLSDGDLPAHRIVLYFTSECFRNYFTNNPTISEVDLTNVNPISYRAFIKYCYQLPLNQLNAEDLVDLYTIAVECMKFELVSDVVTLFENKLNVDNVLSIYIKAKSAKAPAIVELCELLMSTPVFQDSSNYSGNDEQNNANHVVSEVKIEGDEELPIQIPITTDTDTSIKNKCGLQSLKNAPGGPVGKTEMKKKKKDTSHLLSQNENHLQTDNTKEASDNDCPGLLRQRTLSIVPNILRKPSSIK